MTRLVLVRHGESQVTVASVVGGPQSCTGLSPLGRLQAQRLCERWATAPELYVDVLVASQYARARETAEIIAPAIGGLPVVCEAGFGEHDPGPECDGLTYKELLARHPGIVNGWDSQDPFATTFPGGETIAAFQYRVGSAVRRLVEAHEGKTVVVACHGGVIEAVLRLALKAPAMGAFQVYTRNASITELSLVNTNTWRIERYNDAAHLAGLPFSTNAPGG